MSLNILIKRLNIRNVWPTYLPHFSGDVSGNKLIVLSNTTRTIYRQHIRSFYCREGKQKGFSEATLSARNLNIFN